MKLMTKAGAVCVAMMATAVFHDAPAQAQFSTDVCKRPNFTMLVVTLESGFRIVLSLERTGDTIRGVAQAYRTNGISAGHGVVTGQLGGAAQRGQGLVLETRWDGGGGVASTSFQGYLFDGSGRGTATDLDNSNPVAARVTTARDCTKWVPDPRKPAPPPALNAVQRPTVIPPPPPAAPAEITSYTPRAVSTNNWTGVSVGINAGYGLGRVSDNQSRLIGPFVGGPIVNAPAGGNPGGGNPGGGGGAGSGGSSGSSGNGGSSGTRTTDNGYVPDFAVDYGFSLPGNPGRIRDRFHMRGVGVSLQAGYNYQFANNVVLGVDGDIAYTGLSGGGDYHYRGVGVMGIGDWVGNLRLRSDWQISARLKVGYAFDNILLYAAGGLAFANGKLQDSGMFVDLNGRSILYGSNTSNLHVGWTIGVGAEYAISTSWRARTEARYSDFQRKQYQTLNGPVGVSWNQTTIVFGLVHHF